MAKRLTSISPSFLSELRRLMNEMDGPPKNRSDFTDDTSDYLPNELFIARTPVGGIPALDPNMTSGTGSGSGIGTADNPGDDIPGSAEVFIYKIVQNNDTVAHHLEVVPGFTKTVFNLNEVDIPGYTWVPITKDKYGSWIALYSGSTTGNECRITFVSNLCETEVLIGTGTNADAGSQGPNLGSQVEIVTAPGTIAWNNPEYILTDNGMNASVSLAPGESSGVIKPFDFGFSIPGNPSTVVITLELSVGSMNPGEGLSSLSITPFTGNPSTAAPTHTVSNPTSGVLTVGTSGEGWLFAEGWTAAMVNHSSFGILIEVESAGSNTGEVTANIDVVSLELYYAASEMTFETERLLTIEFTEFDLATCTILNKWCVPALDTSCDCDFEGPGGGCQDDSPGAIDYVKQDDTDLGSSFGNWGGSNPHVPEVTLIKSHNSGIANLVYYDPVGPFVGQTTLDGVEFRFRYATDTFDPEDIGKFDHLTLQFMLDDEPIGLPRTHYFDPSVSRYPPIAGTGYISIGGNDDLWGIDWEYVYDQIYQHSAVLLLRMKLVGSDNLTDFDTTFLMYNEDGDTGISPLVHFFSCG